MINSLPIVAAGQQPRGMVLVNGAPVTGWLSAEVVTSNFYQADTWHVVFAVDALPTAQDAAWFLSQSSLQVEILFGFPSDPDQYTKGELTSWVVGNTDNIHYNPAARTLELAGRDLSALLIDTQTTEAFLNQSPQAIMTTIAGRHGLTPVITAAPTSINTGETSVPLVANAQLLGNIYQIDKIHTTARRSEWDAVTHVAQLIDYIVYVQGNSLYCQPRPSPSDDPYVISWTEPTQTSAAQSNAMSLSFERDMTFTGGVTVTACSFNRKHGQPIQQSYPKQPKRSQVGSGGTTTRNYTIYGTWSTPADALRAADGRYKEIVQHEMKLSATLPGDDLLTRTSVIQVIGTGTAFDQVYYPEHITRRMSFMDGYSMSVSAKSVAPGNDIGGQP